MKIPKRFKLFGTTINVVWDNDKCNDLNPYGLHTYSNSTITLSNTDGHIELSEDRIKDCFYHEKVHSILEAMYERDLSKNEKFVDLFAKLLRQSDDTSVYEKKEK